MQKSMQKVHWKNNKNNRFMAFSQDNLGGPVQETISHIKPHIIIIPLSIRD